MPKDASENIGVKIELKPSIVVYSASCRFLSLFKEQSQSHTDRLERLCRYLLASLDAESPKLSYIGVALNKELSISWIRHIKQLLYKCCVCMEKLKPGKHFSAIVIEKICFNFFNVISEAHSESITLALYLHTLVSFTSPNTWALLRVKGLASLKPGMSQLCSNILGALVQKGFFITLRV